MHCASTPVLAARFVGARVLLKLPLAARSVADEPGGGDRLPSRSRAALSRLFPGYRCAQPGLQTATNKQKRKKDAERRKAQTYPPQLALRRAPCRARSPSGVPPRLCPRDSRIPRCDSGPGFAALAPWMAGVSRRRRPRLQRAPRVPVIMPADMMSETARERPAKPPAGAVLAR